MEKFTTITSRITPLNRANVDTDAIIPKQFLKSIKRSGFGVNLFDEWRYIDHGEPDIDHQNRPINKDFVLNDPDYKNSKILLAKKNFGCGSSREHAPWALSDYGIKVIIAPSFADIFYNNCFKNGILPVALTESQVDELFALLAQDKLCAFTVDLEQQLVSNAVGYQASFELDSFRKFCLLQGLDEIGLTLEQSQSIVDYEKQLKEKYPWLI